MKNLFLKRGCALLLAVVIAITLMPAMALTAYAAPRRVPVSSDRVYITSTEYNVVPGAKETVVTTNNTEGTDQKIGFLFTVDNALHTSDDFKIVACYKDNAYEGFGLQTVTDQAAAYEKNHPGEKVVAGMNADFFDMTTGEPMGAFVMEGTVYHGANNRPYFAILKDGTPVIRYGNDLSDVQEAIGGDQIIITDGEITVAEGDYQTLQYSRAALGIKADGTVVTYVTHGISKPTSCGETYLDLANMLKAQGCVWAMNVDGGGSATFASKREGTEKLTVVNNPSDGTPRTVSTTLLFTSSAKATGEFDHAALAPNNTYYTPSNGEAKTQIQFTATGIDASGAACDLPEGLTWEMAPECATMGTVDANGLFTAADKAVGTATVNLKQGSKVVGSTYVQLVDPESIHFGGTGVSLNFNTADNLGLNVRGQGVDLNFKDGDFKWTVTPRSDKYTADQVGKIENNIFTSGPKVNFAMEADVTATYTKLDGTELTATMLVEVGKMPIVAMDFEDVSGPRGKNVVGLWDWGTTAKFFVDSRGNAVTDQYYKFQDYDTLYYLQSTTYSSDKKWINETFQTTQPWVEDADGNITCVYNGETCVGVKEATYGQHAQKWVSFTNSKGEGYYWRGYLNEDCWSGNYNAGGGSASAFLGADGYDMYVWHTNANPTDLAGSLHGEGSKIVDASEGEVRFGNYALKLTYDYTRFSPLGGTKNCNTYYRMTNPLVAQGSPSGLGMWVYAPEGMANFWFWTAITYWNGTDWVDAYIHFKPAGAEKTCQFTGINWTGWSYVEADLSAVYNGGAIVDEDHPLQVRSGNALIQMTYIPGGTSDGEGHAIVCGSKSAGHFYIDDVRWVYGTNIDDMDAPKILDASANDTMLSVAEEKVLKTNDISFTFNFTDPQGENFTGIDVTATQIYLDGKPLPSAQYTAVADKAQTNKLSLANGKHTVELHIADNFGNKASNAYAFVIDNPDSALPTVTIDAPTVAELGADYKVAITATKLDQIASISTNIVYENTAKLDTKSVYMSNSQFYDDYGNLLTLGADGKYYDANGQWVEEPMRPGAAGNYKISNAVQVLGENFTGTIRNKVLNSNSRGFTAVATAKETLTGDNKLLTFTLPVPNTMLATEKVPVSITVTFTTKDGNSYTVSSGKLNNSIEAYYTLTPGINISGAENGTLIVTAKENAAIDNTKLAVFDGETQLEGTWEDNVFTTNYFTSKAVGEKCTNIWVGNATEKHYSFRTDVVTVKGSAQIPPAFALTLNPSTSDTSTEQGISWMSNVDCAKVAKVQYLTKAEYDALYQAEYTKAEAALPPAVEGEEAPVVDEAAVIEAVFASAKETTGSASMEEFYHDKAAAIVNKAKLTGLTPGTTYVYRAGDGAKWSAVSTFKTFKDNGTTSFSIIADAQLYGNDETDATEIAMINKIGKQTDNLDFGLQTGDFVDGGANFTQWEQILRHWGNSFKNQTFVHTMGNHELYGGSAITGALFGLNNSEVDYYSVEYGDVYVAVINQSAASDLKAAAEWLIADAAKTECTWKVLATHQPLVYTNPNGSSQGHNNILVPACDAAGIDFTFAGHDHSYARTEQMKNYVPVDLKIDEKTNSYVDEQGAVAATQGQGTVYMIAGSLHNEKSGYGIVDNPDFHFAATNQDYNALYLTAEADKNHFTVKAWNVVGDGRELVDTFTMYSAAGACAAAGEHVLPQDEAKYNVETGKLVCDRCAKELDPADEKIMYTGFAVDMNGVDEYGDSQYYLLAGKVRTGFFPFGDEFMYADEKGLIDHATINYMTQTCTTTGKRMAYSPRADKSYTGGNAKFTGHNYVEDESGKLVCTNTYCTKTATGFEEHVCGHEAIDVANWNYSLQYTTMTYTGQDRRTNVIVKDPVTGKELTFNWDGMGKLTDFHRTWSNNKNVGTASVLVEINPVSDYISSKEPVTLTMKIVPPNATGLKVASADRTSVTLNWKASAQTDNYRVYRKTAAGYWAMVGETADTSYTISGLNAESTYEFTVKSTKTVDGVQYTAIGYADSVTANTAAGLNIADMNAALSYTETTYNGNKKLPVPTITDANGNELTKGEDYTYTRIDNVDVGTGKVIITGTGEYTGELVAEFTIKPQSLYKSATVVAEDAVYAGDNTTTTVTVTDKNGNVLVADKDYTLEYSKNNAVGVATVKVLGIGNYRSNAKADFKITAQDLSGKIASVAADSNLTYTGAEVTPAIVIEGLTAGTDFTVAYENNVNVGTATATVTGIGNYTGEIKVTFQITPASIEDAVVTDGAVYVYTGEEIEAVINVVSAANAVLEADKDFVVDGYENNVEVGTAVVTISGKGNYTGTIKHEFYILAMDIEAFSVTVDPETFVYDGTEKVPTIHVLNADGEELVADTDYTVAFENNKEAGAATVTVTGKGNYTGIVTKAFNIKAADLNDGTVELRYETTTYTGGFKKPAVTVKAANGKKLVADKDYTVVYANNKNAGTATVTVSGIGNFTGKVEKSFAIEAADLTACTLTLEETKFDCTDKEIKPELVVTTAKGTVLKKGLNYEVSYENNVQPGTATVTVTGINNYAGTLSATFTIKEKRSIEGFSAKLSYNTLTYTGKARTPGVTLKTTKGTTLVKGKNYTVTYSDNVEVGTATVTIKGIGKYTGTITKTFKIRPEKVDTLKVVSTTKNTAKVNFKFVDSADKYYIYVNGKYYGCSKTLDTYTIKNLKPNTSYKIYVKAVKVVDGKNFVSAIGNKVTAKTK